MISRHLKSGRGFVSWHAMTNIKYQGLSKISYVKLSLICSITPQNAQTSK